MPTVNFSEIEDDGKYPPLPKGQYPCSIVMVTVESTRKGDEMWNIRFEVTEGQYAGRLIFDRLVFKGKGYVRIKGLCQALGLDVTGRVDLTPDAIHGRSCLVEVHIKEFEDHQGQTQKANNVAFDGFRPAKHKAQTTTTGSGGDDDDMPF